MKTTDTMATPTTVAAIEAYISNWRVPVARRQTLDEAKIPDAYISTWRVPVARRQTLDEVKMPDAESLAAGGSEVVMPDAESLAAGGSEVVTPDGTTPCF
jgi:hypothetical protein